MAKQQVSVDGTIQSCSLIHITMPMQDCHFMFGLAIC